jgi:methyl acetate hydrolase
VFRNSKNLDRRRLLGGLALVLVSLAFTSAPLAARPALSSTASSELSKQLTAAVERGDTPGVVAMVVSKDGEIFSATAGSFDVGKKVSMPPNAIFNIASMTKPVTSVAIMMLLEEGKLTLDDPVAKHLPVFENIQVIETFNAADGSFTARPAKKVMTLRHLLTHTSGIGYSFSSPILAKLQGGSPAAPKMEWEYPLLHEPGEKWTYGASTRVLGLIVEKITGEQLENYYQRRIFKPLGMKDTSWAVAADKQSRVPTNHRRVNGKWEEQPRTPIPSTPAVPQRGDGGLYCTAHDYGLFLRMLLNGGTLGSVRILKPESVKLMGENHIGDVVVSLQPVGIEALTKPFPLGAGHDKFGLGFQIASNEPSGEGFRSPGSMSWAGLFNTEFWIDPVRQIGGIHMMQQLPFYDEGAIRALRGFEEIVYKELR